MPSGVRRIAPRSSRPQKPVEAPAVPMSAGDKPGELGSAPAGWVVIEVEHLAAPQGSHFSPAKGVVRESNPRTELYRQAVADACEDRLEEPLDGPLEVEILFRMMPAPKSDPRRPYPHYPPDLDKLVRATFDGITRGQLWVDDGRACKVTAWKTHASTPEQTGVTIRVRPLL